MRNELHEIASSNGNGLNGHPVKQPPVVEERPEEVDDIMSKPPHWIIRRGITILLVLMALLFLGAGFIHYPDVIETKITIVSSNPPLKLMSRSTGKIQNIFVSNDQHIQAGQVICLIENPAKFEDVTMLQSFMDKLDLALNDPASLNEMHPQKTLQLGEMQLAYNEACQAIMQYQFYTRNSFSKEKISQLRSQIGYYQELNSELYNRDSLLGRKLQLEKNKLQADSSLYAGRVIASLAYDATKKQYLDEELNAKSNKTSIIQNKIQQAEYNKSITLLNQQTLQETYDLIEKVRNSLQKLYAVYVDWEQKYVIKSPLEGKVVFFQFWKVNQYIASGEAMVMVVPKIQNYIARASLPSWGIGKIKQDQRALIKLSEYPFQEFGMVEGVVQNISPVSMDNNYLLEINLKNGLTTTMNKQIPNQPELIGSAEVLTSDKSILARIFEKLIVISQ